MPQPAPSLFLIGAQRGGSTNLASHLEQAPQIAYFGRKEPNIFSIGSEAECRAKLNSIVIAEDAPPILLDGSPNYSRAPYIGHVPEMIALIIGKQTPKFIYSLRDPVERTISHYFWSREKFGETYSLEEAIERDVRYIDASRYDMQIERYLEIFDVDQFYFVKFENYISDPLTHLPPLLEWAGATMPNTFKPKPEFDAATDKVSTKKALFPLANRLARKQGVVRNFIQAYVPAGQHERLAGALSRPAPSPEISEDTKQTLRETYFMKTIERTSELTGLNLSDWLAPKAASSTNTKAD